MRCHACVPESVSLSIVHAGPMLNLPAPPPPNMHAWGGLHPHADVILHIALSHPDMIKRPLTWLAP